MKLENGKKPFMSTWSKKDIYARATYILNIQEGAYSPMRARKTVRALTKLNNKIKELV